VSGANKEMLEKLKSIASREHTPPRIGKYSDRTLHERDRWAKWGNSNGQPQKIKGKVNRIKHKNLIPAKKMKLVSFSSENTSNRRLAKYAIDGDPRTIWHTRWSDRTEKHPHQLVIDLEAKYQVSGVRYLVRQDGGWNGAFADVEFYISNNAEQFGSKPNGLGKFKKDKKSQSINFEKSKEGRYLKIKILSEVNGGTWASAAEIGVIGVSSP
ncbi:MAG: discoidin domain-containing protein, partial [Verrucomicrobiota bacterium]|nr:discoidin domain-containing protein [Verrucomicrobiota bacterium]